MDKDWKPEHRPANAPANKNRKEILTDANISEIAADEFSDQQPSKIQSAFEKGKDKESSSFSKKTLFTVLGGIIILILALILFILPGMKGYSVYKAMQASGVPDTYATDMASLQKAKENADSASAQAAQAVTQCQEAQNTAFAAKDAAEAQAQLYSRAADQMQTERDLCIKEKKDMEKTLADAANRLCCISKFTNDAINAYAIVDDTVTCVSEGGTPIEC